MCEFPGTAVRSADWVLVFLVTFEGLLVELTDEGAGGAVSTSVRGRVAVF